MSNSVNLALDVTKTGIQNTLIKVRQGDGGFETLHTTVTSNGEPMDLQGWTITFMGTTAGNHKIIDANVKIVEAPNGIFEYTPSKAWGMDIGYFKIAYFKFVKGDGSASSANFRVNVIEAVDLTQEEAQNYISVVDATISEIDKHLNDSLANITQSIAETSSAASSLEVNVSSVASSAVNQINDTASSAAYNVNGVASNAVNNVSVTASGAVDHVNDTASNVVNDVNSTASSAVDNINDVASNTVNNVNSIASSAVDNVNNTASNAVDNVNVTASNAINSITGSVTSLGNRVNDYNNKLAAIQVGGRNLMLGTGDWSGGNARWNQRGTVTTNAYRGTLIAATSSPWKSPAYMIQNTGILQVGKTYTFSTYVRNTSDTDTTITFLYDYDAIKPNGIVMPLPAHTGWTRVSGNFIVIKDTPTATDGLRWEARSGLTNGQVQFAGYKLEEGNVPTDWTPAPEDVPSNDTQLVHKTGNETIAGDKTLVGNTSLATTTILAGSYGLRVTASGVQKTTDGKTWVAANI